MTDTVTPQVGSETGLATLRRDLPRFDRIDRYIRGDHDGPYTPRTATDEYKLLAKRAVSNWLPLLVKTPAQALSVEGFRRAGITDGSQPPEWQAWQTNRMGARQAQIHRAALTFGQAWVTVLPDPADPRRPVIRGVSPRRMIAFYADPASDSLPLWALQVDAVPASADEAVKGWFIDGTGVTELSIGGKEGTKVLGFTAHSLGVCPVVRFAPDVDLEGRVTGVIEGMIPIQDRINQSVFDLLVAETFGSFKVRTISGMAPEIVRDPETGEPVYDPATGKPKVLPIQADASRFLVAPDPDTKFAQLDETPLQGYIDAIEMSVRHLAAVAQVPAQHLIAGTVANMSAEGLGAAESAMFRAIAEFKNSFGDSWETVGSLCALTAGSPPPERAHVVWGDAESRSLSQTVDALGKAVQMLGVPARALWPRIPGVTATDVDDWAQIQTEDDPGLRLADSIAKVPALAGAA
ncbi:phage portal protein [Kitasatospora purpeofusca]|uniref:phage portal protein n=1 Tax=Kitasatospora purpeofusca TaxID=67352 RepID=UPI002E0E8A0B|nr:phage portal protein [Kitasatospora purpeofusca]